MCSNCWLQEKHPQMWMIWDFSLIIVSEFQPHKQLSLPFRREKPSKYIRICTHIERVCKFSPFRLKIFQNIFHGILSNRHSQALVTISNYARPFMNAVRSTFFVPYKASKSIGPHNGFVEKYKNIAQTRPIFF